VDRREHGTDDYTMDRMALEVIAKAVLTEMMGSMTFMTMEPKLTKQRQTLFL
jgi:hypothetical protein